MSDFLQMVGNGLPFPPPGNLPNPGIKPTSPLSPSLQVDSLLAEPSGKPTDTSTYIKKKELNQKYKNIQVVQKM